LGPEVTFTTLGLGKVLVIFGLEKEENKKQPNFY
jgi:hypothetical protein